MEQLGCGTMPEPARPGWNELANGSMDAQWVEFRGVVSDVQSNRLTFLLPDGTIEAAMENHIEADLKQYLHAVVRVRGTLFAIWNAGTREVQFGSVLMRNATVSLEAQPPASPFDAPAKSARDLLRFDVQAAAFSPVKVRAQVLCADAQTIFAMDEGAGLRVQAANPPSLRPGDWFEAVGYPEISGPSPLLRHAVVRKSGAGSLPKPTVLDESNLRRKGLDSITIHIEHKAGDKMYVDFTGVKHKVTDAKTGDVTEYEVFVAVLGCSQKAYLEGTATQTKADWVQANENALRYFKGVPSAIVPDCLKSAVTKADKYDPIINQTYSDFGRHYGTTILPARALHPKDKSLGRGVCKDGLYAHICTITGSGIWFNTRT